MLPPLNMQNQAEKGEMVCPRAVRMGGTGVLSRGLGPRSTLPGFTFGPPAGLSVKVLSCKCRLWCSVCGAAVNTGMWPGIQSSPGTPSLCGLWLLSSLLTPGAGFINTWLRGQEKELSFLQLLEPYPRGLGRPASLDPLLGWCSCSLGVPEEGLRVGTGGWEQN